MIEGRVEREADSDGREEGIGRKVIGGEGDDERMGR